MAPEGTVSYNDCATAAELNRVTLSGVSHVSRAIANFLAAVLLLQGSGLPAQSSTLADKKPQSGTSSSSKKKKTSGSANSTGQKKSTSKKGHAPRKKSTAARTIK